MGGGLRELLLTLGFEVDEKSEKGVHDAIAGIKHAAIALGEAFAIKEIAEFVTETIEHVAHLGDEISKTSERIGVSVESLQELGYAAKLSGASQEDLNSGLKFLSRNAVEAASGNKELRTEFARLGLSVTDAHGKIKPADTLLAQLSDRFAKLPEGPLRTQAAMKLMGRGGTALIPMLSKGSKALADYAAEAEELGIMSEHLTELSVEYDDALKRNAQATDGVRMAFAEELLPTFTALKNAGTIFMVKVLRPMAHVLGKALADAIHTVGRAFGYLRSLAHPVIEAFKTLTDHFGGASHVVDLFAAAIVGLSGILAAKALLMAASWAIANAPLLLSLGLLAAFAVLLGLAIQDLTSKDSILKEWWNTWSEGWANLKEEAGSTLGAIGKIIDTAVDFWVQKIKDFLKIFDDAATKTAKVSGLKGASDAVHSAGGITSYLNPLSAIQDLWGSIRGPSADVVRQPAGGGGGMQSSVQVTIQADVSGGTPQENAAAIADHTVPTLVDAIRAAHQQFVPVGPASR